ncbi:MAG: phosphoglucomutase, partial [Spirochaetales bacterium]
GETESEKQQVFFKTIQNVIKEQSLSILCDMNGSARCLSIDKQFLSDQGINFISFNDIAGNIVHAIIPEGENLQYCAKEMEALHNSGKTDVLLAYMPDCDGDRGNIVYWNTHTQRAEILQAQEVFALCVLSELAYSVYRAKQNNQSDNLKLAVAVNGPTSMRIDDIAKVFDAKVCRAEVGEANVVNRARELRNEGYSVPILGEGSNGGNITHPAAVRDPMNTLFALIKLLTLKSNGDTPGLFELWCKKSGQPEKYNQNFSFADISETLPHYTSTGGSEKRGLLHIKSKNHITLKANLQKLFVAAWEEKKDSLLSAYGIVSWDALATVGTEEKSCTEDFTLSMSGGLKIRFKTQEGISASVWMRASGTEPVFRIMCDAKGKNTETEKELLDWVTKLLEKADTM